MNDTDPDDDTPGAGADAADVLTQDTKYVFDANEASVLVPLIDEAFQRERGAGPGHGAGAEGGSRDYLDAHTQFRTRIATLLGTTVHALDVGGGKGDEAVASDEAGSGETEPGQVDPAEVRASPPVGEPIRHELDRALMYEFIVPFDGPVTCTLGHYDRDSEFVWPPRIANVTESVVDLWEYMATRATAHAAVARFHDLVFIRGRDRFTHAAAARDAYLAFAAQAAVVDLDQAYALLRAWAIDRIFRRVPELEETRLAIETAITTAWDAGRGYPGVVLPLINALCQTQETADADPVQVDALLDRASSLYGATESVGYVAELRRGRATTDAERTAVDRWHVEQLAAVARTSDGFVKAMRLRDAIREAGRAQLRDLEERLTVELQSLSPEDAKLESFTSDFRMSRLPIERFLRQFTQSPNWRRSLHLFSQTPPPTGSVEQLKRAEEQRLLRPRLVDIVSTVLLDEDRLPSWEPTTVEEQLEYQKARDAGLSAAVTATHLAEVLDRFKSHYGAITVDDLAAYVSHQGRGNYELAAVFARALHHYWNGDLEACVHIAVPRIESAVRLILRELDVAIYRVQLGKRPGQYPPLGSLLGELADLGFDEGWVYYLRWLLTDHTGRNLRNEVAHGRVRGASEADAVMVLRALLLVVLLCGPGNADDVEVDLAQDQPPGESTGSKSGSESESQPGVQSGSQSGNQGDEGQARPASGLRDLIRWPLMEPVKLPRREVVVARQLAQMAWSRVTGRS